MRDMFLTIMKAFLNQNMNFNQQQRKQNT